MNSKSGWAAPAQSEGSPWVSQPAAPLEAPPEAPERPRERVTPQPGIVAPSEGGLPTRAHVGRAALWVLGVHGGAAESAIAQLDPTWAAAEHAWPSPPPPQPPRVVLTCRSSAGGLLAAQSAARQWAASATPQLDLLGLVIVADAPGRLPKPLRDLAALVAGGVPRTWTLPWIEAWRLGEQPPPDQVRALRRLVTDLTSYL